MCALQRTKRSGDPEGNRSFSLKSKRSFLWQKRREKGIIIEVAPMGAISNRNRFSRTENTKIQGVNYEQIRNCIAEPRQDRYGRSL